jgi:transposase-like protein
VTRAIVEEALEDENHDAIGRVYYEHGVVPDQEYCNGSRTGRLKTAKGVTEYPVPQIAGRDKPFHSEIRDRLKGRTKAPEDLAIELLAQIFGARHLTAKKVSAPGQLV